MTGIEAVAAVSGTDAAPLAMRLGGDAGAASPARADFSSLLMSGLQNMDAKVNHADQLVRQFAVDDSVPVHQVTIALEQARLAVEITMQVRDRLIEGYREFMNMPL